MNNSRIKKLKLQCFPFQIIMLSSFLIYMCYKTEVIAPSYIKMFDIFGCLLFSYCLIKIYTSKSLITTGVFKYCRHPMYTGFFLMCVYNWYPLENSILYFSTIFLSIGSMLIAGYLQELETVEKFGEEATKYYEKTKRFIII